MSQHNNVQVLREDLCMSKAKMHTSEGGGKRERSEKEESQGVTQQGCGVGITEAELESWKTSLQGWGDLSSPESSRGTKLLCVWSRAKAPPQGEPGQHQPPPH